MSKTSVGILASFAVFLFAISGCGERDTLEMSEPTRVEVPGEERRMSGPSTDPITEERTFYDFETPDLTGWGIPQWTLGKNDYVAERAVYSEEVASRGKGSMKVEADFPGGIWTAALVEIQQYLNLTNYRVLMADVYLPEDAPVGLTAKLIITVGENWKFIEMNRSYPLMPGEWVQITASIEPGSYDWKRVVPDNKFAEDIRKIAVRVESNQRPKYKGPFFVDNVRAGR